jgi:hypothetical protein
VGLLARELGLALLEEGGLVEESVQELGLVGGDLVVGVQGVGGVVVGVGAGGVGLSAGWGCAGVVCLGVS